MWHTTGTARAWRSLDVRDLRFVTGPTLLRTVAPDPGQPVVLQLEQGLFPVEVFAARASRTPTARVHDTRFACWVPTPFNASGHPVVAGPDLDAWLRREQPLGPFAGRGRAGFEPPTDVAPCELVRATVTLHGGEESIQPGLAAVLAEWTTLDPTQIELLRRTAVVARPLGSPQ